MSDTAFASATELTRRLREREISCEELLNHFLARVDRHNEGLNAIVVEVRERAIARAREADAALLRGESWGSLHGLPMTIKESYNLTGQPTTWGSPAWRDNIATEDALAVQRLEGAGAIVFGKTNVPLMLADFQSYNEIYGTTNNPWDLTRTPGGSSGGSAAALAAGLTSLEIGSDIGGSIRNPAHYCGVFGHKPTWELCPMRGHAGPGALTPSDISVIGPLARSAYDLQLALEAMAGPDSLLAGGYKLDLTAANQRSLGEFRVAVWRDDPIAPVDNEVSARVDDVAAAFAAAGATVDTEARPSFTAEHIMATYQQLLWANMAGRLPDETYESLQRAAAALAPDDDSGGARLLRSQVSSYRTWAKNNEARTHLRWAYHQFFKDYDLILSPAASVTAFPHDQGDMAGRRLTVNGESQAYFAQLFWAGYTGVCYLPSTVIPTGPSKAGLPIGVQLVGKEYGDLTTLRAAQLLEDAGFAFQPAPAYAD